jgi:hypothetical protein
MPQISEEGGTSLAGAAVNFILLILCASMGCQRQNGFLVGFVFFQDAGDTPSCITMTRSLMPRISGSSEETIITATPIRQFTDQMINFRLRPDVDTAGRLIEN